MTEVKSESGSQPGAPEILAKVAQIASLSREDYQGDDFDGHVKKLFAETYEDLFREPQVITATSLIKLSDPSHSYIEGHSKSIRDRVSSLKVPGTDIPMFLHGGSYSLFTSSGKLVDFMEEREGLVYRTPDNPHNAAPFTVAKPLALFMLRALGRELDLSNQENADLIANLIGKTMHLGGIPAEFSTMRFGIRQMMMGISSVELTPGARSLIQTIFIRNGAEHSLDNSTQDHHFTAAGFFDELAGKVAVAHLTNSTPVEVIEIAKSEWSRLEKVAIPGPLPAQYH